MIDKQRIYDEDTCTRIFLEWLGVQQGTEWAFKRAEDEFPELANKTRWEFVARRTGNKSTWVALEVKRLVVSEGVRQHSDWHKLIVDVNKRVSGELPGKYWLAKLPKYSFNQKQRQVLVDKMAQVIQEVAPVIETGATGDIGPDIANLFDAWPEDRRKQPMRIDLQSHCAIYPPHPLLMLKSSEDGSSLGMGASPVVVYWTEPTLQKAILDLLDKGNQNDQLGLAKSRGALKTFLLVDERIDFDPGVITQAVGGVDPALMSNIDEMYLVSTFGGEHVKQVWPKAG